MRPVFRFAPSPTGYLHLGHAYAALVGFERCRAADGRFLLRMEDIDATRSRPEFEAAIIEDLRWLGLTWEDPVRRQSEHLADYRTALDRLTVMELVYPSFMSRAEIAARAADPDWPRDPDGAPLNPGYERTILEEEVRQRIAAGEPHAFRLRMDAALEWVGPLAWKEETDADVATITADPATWGDIVIARKETPTSYHLSVVVDDALQGVSHIVRGRDLYHATSVHVLLQRLLGLPSPVYHHHRLILDVEGRKLSKTDKAASLRSLRAAGATAADVRRMVGL